MWHPRNRDRCLGQPLPLTDKDGTYIICTYIICTYIICTYIICLSQTLAAERVGCP